MDILQLSTRVLISEAARAATGTPDGFGLTQLESRGSPQSVSGHKDGHPRAQRYALSPYQRMTSLCRHRWVSCNGLVATYSAFYP